MAAASAGVSLVPTDVTAIDAAAAQAPLQRRREAAIASWGERALAPRVELSA